jgi:hypothetical protein
MEDTVVSHNFLLRIPEIWAGGVSLGQYKVIVTVIKRTAKVYKTYLRLTLTSFASCTTPPSELS